MKFRLIASLFLLFPLSAAFAQHSDIEIEIEGGNLATDPRIGEGEFGEAPNPANVADEPGLEVDEGMFNPGEILHFNAVDVLGSNLWFWDGTGSVNFGATAATLDIKHPTLPLTTTLSSADSGGATGFLVGQATDVGGGVGSEIHQDLEFELSDMMPAAGVYLFGLEVYGTEADGTTLAYGASEPVYFVLGSGVEEAEIDAAVDWVADTFSIPEPSSGILFLMALPLLARRIRR